jgi:hypothetical protein
MVLNFVISVTSPELKILVQNNFMEHRGIRYAVRIGIAREQWRVAIYPSGNGLPKERTVVGTHEDAEIDQPNLQRMGDKVKPSVLIHDRRLCCL